MVVAPASEWAGVTDSTYGFTLTNLNKTQSLGSADVTIPSALTPVGAPSRGTLAGNVLELRDVDLAPGASMSVTVPLRMPCVAGAYDWRIDARQSNDFSGPPGNALGPVSGLLTTTVTGNCALRYVAKPANAGVGAQIRADAYLPQSPNRVTVEALDGRPTGAERLTWFSGTLSLRLAPSSYSGRLSPTTASSAAAAGVASFGNLAINASGVYSLRASGPTGFSTTDSDAFQVIDVVANCNSAQCRAEVGASTLTGTNVDGSGFALLSQNLGPAPVCAGYTPPTSNWYEFQLTVAADKTVETYYTKNEVRAAGNRQSLEICFAAPRDFAAKGGATAPFDYDGDGTLEGFVGLLPDCPGTPVSPCVLDRSSAGGGAATVSFFVPAAWGNDPRYR
jgi:hypothetical protein